jgi:tRNA-specific adenosine deaminase 2
MTEALRVAQTALSIGEVPVGCVIVLRDASDFLPNAQTLLSNVEDRSVIISHGANQVNACRDATRHAEIVAIDRMLTGSISSDLLNISEQDGPSEQQPKGRVQDAWENVKGDPNHWKNSFGWGSGRMFQKDIFPLCDLYVTCEPCIMVRETIVGPVSHFMKSWTVLHLHIYVPYSTTYNTQCATALARLGIGRVIYGCKNDRFGGCGSLLHMHRPSTYSRAAEESGTYRGYPIITGILETQAISLLRSFYDRENDNAPEEKRKRKYPKVGSGV